MAMPESSLSAKRVARSQAGKPIRMPHDPVTGSLATGMHYSAADVTSFRWKELERPAPQQAAFTNRVDVLKIGLENALLDMKASGQQTSELSD